jgi:Tfp pilus assembly protein PilF
LGALALSLAVAGLMWSASFAFPLDDPQAPDPAPSQAARRVSARTLESGNRRLADAMRMQQKASTAESERRLAQEYFNVGVLDMALDHFRAVLKFNSRDPMAHEAVARIWRDWGYPHLGLASAYRAVFWAPNSASAQNTLGTVLLKIGSFDTARQRFQRARQLDPRAAYPVNNLCYLALLEKRAHLAVDLCQRAAALDGVTSTVRNNLAMAQATTGDLDGAFTTFEDGSSVAVAAYNQGLLLLAARQPDLARAAFMRARNADPTFAPALSRLKRMAAGMAGR